jgi:hypothetical protein
MSAMSSIVCCLEMHVSSRWCWQETRGGQRSGDPKLGRRDNTRPKLYLCYFTNSPNTSRAEAQIVVCISEDAGYQRDGMSL